MAGGPSTVQLAAAVCEAGGLGFLAGGYRPAEMLAREIAELRALTHQPFGVNVFVVPREPIDEHAVAGYVRSLRPHAERFGVAVGNAIYDDDDIAGKLAVLLDAAVPVVSFTFACPSPKTVQALQSVGSRVWVTVASVADAREALETGCDALVVQGLEAGGHRGAFHDDGGEGALGTVALVQAVAALASVPLIAAGGVATAADVRAVRAAGAAAAQAGTAFLLTPEAGTDPLHRTAVASDAPTALTRAFTGRTARGIENAFMRMHLDAPAAYPHIHHATAPIRSAARAAGDPSMVSLWAGERHALARSVPAADVVRALAAPR